MEDQREFVEHLQIGKQIGKLLDMPKGPQAQKHMFCDLKVQKDDFVDYVRNEAMLVLVFYYFFETCYFWQNMDVLVFYFKKHSLLAQTGFQTTFLDFGHLKVQKVDLFDYVRNKAMLVLVFYFFPKHATFVEIWTC